MPVTPPGSADRSESKAGGRWGRTTASQLRRQDILTAAKSVFFEQGYQLASVDKIAAAAGTTKRTVYDHFGSKQALFSEVIAYGCELFVNALPQAGELPNDPRAGLLAFTARVADLVGAPDGVRFQRLIIAEAERHPEFGKVLYDTAFRGAQTILCRYLAGRIAARRLKAHDVDVFARVILDLATNSVRLRGLLALEDPANDRLGRKALRETIGLFLTAYRP